MNFLSLSSIFTNLAKSFSEGFWVAGVFPGAMFFFANAVLIYMLDARFRALSDALWKEARIAKGAALAAFAAMAIVVFAYTITALSTRLRKVLEGDWPRFLASIRAGFVEGQGLRRKQIQDRIDKVFEDRRMELHQEDLKRQLRLSRIQGGRANAGQAWHAVPRAGRDRGALTRIFSLLPPTRPSHVAIPTEFERMRQLKQKNDLIPGALIENSVRWLQREMITHDADASPDLNKLQIDVTRLLDYAVERAREEHFQLYNLRQFNCGSAIIAPTEMGNIAASIQAYAVRYYNLNLELFWSSLQRFAQKDKDFAPTVADAKTRLDFLIACFWVTALFWAEWSIALPIVSFRPVLFACVALVGPIACYGWYRAATEQYRAFADTIKTMIDMFRFDVLDGLKLRRPNDVDDERDIWRYLNGAIQYEEAGNFRDRFSDR